MSEQIRVGEVWGLPVMKFTLTYDGPLPSSGNKPKTEAKWDIRKKLHPQLVDLWGNHPALREVEANRHFPKTGGASLRQGHHLHPGPVGIPTEMFTGPLAPPRRESLDLCEPINKHGKIFLPLVRESHALHCGLKILFLRKEPPGRVYQGGDMDGRMKTLLDGLSAPQHAEQMINDSDIPQPLYCLLEEDSLVSGLHIESERLLTDESHAKDYVRLIIEVDVRVRQATIYNQSFLG